MPELERVIKKIPTDMPELERVIECQHIKIPTDMPELERVIERQHGFAVRHGCDAERFRLPGAESCRRHHNIVPDLPLHGLAQCHLTVARVCRGSQGRPCDPNILSVKVKATKHT